MKDEGSAGATVENTHEPLAEESGRKYGADLQQQGYFFLPRDKAIVEAIAIDMNEGFTSANAPYIDRVEGRDAALSRRVPSHDGLCGNGNYNERTDK